MQNQAPDEPEASGPRSRSGSALHWRLILRSRYSAAAADLARSGHVADVLGCAITIADLEMTQGRLSDAERTFERALALVVDALDRAAFDPSWSDADTAADDDDYRRAATAHTG